MNGTQLLDGSGLKALKDVIEANGYPDIAIGNLMLSLGITPDVATMDSMPIEIGGIVAGYVTQASQLKAKMRRDKNFMPSTVNAFIVDINPRTNRRISMKQAKDSLKVYYKQRVDDYKRNVGDIFVDYGDEKDEIPF